MIDSRVFLLIIIAPSIFTDTFEDDPASLCVILQDQRITSLQKYHRQTKARNSYNQEGDKWGDNRYEIVVGRLARTVIKYANRALTLQQIMHFSLSKTISYPPHAHSNNEA